MDNYDLWKAHDNEQQEKLEELPVCIECGEPIQEETCYHFENGLICDNCMYENHKVYTDNYMKEV